MTGYWSRLFGHTPRPSAIRSPTENTEDFEVLRPQGELGQGSQGYVRTKWLNGDYVAYKTITYSPGSKGSVNASREVNALKSLKHENIIQYIMTESFESTPTRHGIKIYMEYCEYGSLKDVIEVSKERSCRIDESYIWNIISQVAAALKYCHYGLTGDSIPVENAPPWDTVLHRDIKPGNILLKSDSRTATDVVKLADFGLSVTLHANKVAESYIGTRLYNAPEIDSNTAHITWTRECDIYSFGLTIYELCALEIPFSYRRSSVDQTIPSLPPHYSKFTDRLVSLCTSFSPNNRPSVLSIHCIAKMLVAKQQTALEDLIDDYLLHLEKKKDQNDSPVQSNIFLTQGPPSIYHEQFTSRLRLKSYIKKCDKCRNRKQECTSKERRWDFQEKQKCDYCSSTSSKGKGKGKGKGRACGPNRGPPETRRESADGCIGMSVIPQSTRINGKLSRSKRPGGVEVNEEKDSPVRERWKRSIDAIILRRRVLDVIRS